MVKAQLIVVAVPGGEHASYYKKQLNGSLKPVVTMFSEYSVQVAEAGDEFLVVYSRDQRRLLDEVTFHPSTRFLLVDRPLDLWMRDFTTTIPDLQVKFRYRPDYLTKVDAKNNEKDFLKLLKDRLGLTLPDGRFSLLKLDGGNVVDNGIDKLVIAKRALRDNEMTSQQFTTRLDGDLSRLGATRTVCLLEDQGDTTGHADGLVAFVDQRTILVGHYGDEKAYQADVTALRKVFGDERQLDVVKLPCYETKENPAAKGQSKKTEQFDSAEGAYINMLVTDLGVYVPQFGSAHDSVALDIVRASTGKKVFSVNTGQLAHMGGNIRCMSWQMHSDTDIAMALLGVSSHTR